MYLKLAVFYNNWKSIDPDCWNNMKNKKIPHPINRVLRTFKFMKFN